MAGVSSKEAQAYLIDPMNAPEPAAETGPGAHFTSTFDPKHADTMKSSPSTTSPRSSLGSKNPFRDTSSPTQPSSPPSASKNGTHVIGREVGHGKSGSHVSTRESPSEAFPNYRAEAFGDYNDAPPHRSPSSAAKPPPSYDDVTTGAASGSGTRGRRRTSSLKERFPGDRSGEPLSIIRRESKKAARSPHLNKRHLPGPDMIDRLDPALGGRAYHHEGPYDAAALSRNRDPKTAPVAALETSNAEALKATPRENIKDAVERHKPLDGVAFVPPGVPDQFGRTYDYEEGTDMQREGVSDAGYKRWPGKTYDPDDLDGKAEPAFSLDRALQAHKIDDNGIEMEDRAHLMKDYHRAERNGSLDKRDPVTIAGDDRKYQELEMKNAHGELGDGHGEPLGGPGHDNDAGVRRTGSLSLKEGLKKRIGSLRHRKHDE